MSVPVYVVNMRGQPLMPTTPRKARRLVKTNKATVLQRLPFTIQLHYATGEAKQEITLGIDAGYSMIGFSARTEKQATLSLKATPFMNVVRTHLVEELKCETTYGYITKHDRSKLGLAKSHVNDAFVIAGGTNQTRCRPLQSKQIRRNNRSIQTNRKGFKPSIRRQRYPIQPHDLVRYEGELYRVKGVFNYGKWVRMVKVVAVGQPKPLNKAIKKVKLVKYGKGFNFSYLSYLKR